MAKKSIPTGDLIDKLYRQDKEIDDIESTLRQAKAVREELQVQLLASFGSSKLNGARGKLATAYVRVTQYPTIKNRAKFLKYVTTKKAYDLFQNRISSTAYFDRVEDGEFVPGIEVRKNTRVSVTRSK